MSTTAEGGEAAGGAPQAPLPSGISVQELKHITALRMAKHQELQRQAQHQVYHRSYPMSMAPAEEPPTPEANTKPRHRDRAPAPASVPQATSVPSQAMTSESAAVSPELPPSAASPVQPAGAPVPAAGNAVPPMPHGLTVQELKELTRMRLARERISGFHGPKSYPPTKLTLPGDPAASMQTSSRTAHVYPGPPAAVSGEASHLGEATMRAEYMMDGTKAAAATSAAPHPLTSTTGGEPMATTTTAPAAGAANRRAAAGSPVAMDPMVAAAAAAAAAAAGGGGGRGWAGVVKGMQPNGPTRGIKDMLVLDPAAMQDRRAAELESASAQQRMASMLEAAGRPAMVGSAKQGPVLGIRLPPKASTSAEDVPQRRERPSIRLSIQPPRPDELPPLSIRGRSLSSTSVDSEDLPYQMAEYVLLTPKSPASPAIRDGRLMADLFVSHANKMAAVQNAAGNNAKVTVSEFPSPPPTSAPAAYVEPMAGQSSKQTTPNITAQQKASAAGQSNTADATSSAKPGNGRGTRNAPTRAKWFFGSRDDDVEDEGQQSSSGGEKEAEDGDKLSGGFSEDGSLFPTPSSSSGYTLDSSEEEADSNSGTVTSPATYTDGLSPTARQLAKIAELSVNEDKAHATSLLMRMAPQGPGKVSFIRQQPLKPQQQKTR